MSIAAFFDLDGTLLPGPSLERRFRRFLRWHNYLGAVAAARWLVRFLASAGRDPLAAAHSNKACYAGVPASTLADFAASLLRHPPPVYCDALARMDWHAARGHRILVITGSLDPLASAVLSPLSAQLVTNRASLSFAANQLEIRNTRFTGRLAGPAVCGPEKARAIKRLALALHLDLARCYAYSNGFTDRWMLATVGFPAVVNPDALLEFRARRQGWPILRWASLSSGCEERLAQPPAPQAPGEQHHTRPDAATCNSSVESGDCACLSEPGAG